MGLKDFERIDTLERQVMMMEQLLTQMVEITKQTGLEVAKQNSWARDIITKQIRLIEEFKNAN